MPVVRRRYDDGLHILVLKNPAQVCCTFSSSRFLEVRKPFLVRITDPGDFSDLLEFVAMVVCPSTAADQGYLELRSRRLGAPRVQTPRQSRHPQEKIVEGRDTWNDLSDKRRRNSHRLYDSQNRIPLGQGATASIPNGPRCLDENPSPSD